MSKKTLCEKHSVIVKTQVSTKTAGGAAIKAWTGNPRTVKCNRQGVPSEECTALGIRAGVESFKLFHWQDPQITVKDHVFLKDASGTVYKEYSVIRPSRSEVEGRLGVIWTTVIQDFQASNS